MQVITPNPKTSGGARWNYLAAYAWALKQPGGTPAAAEAYLAALFKNVPVLRHRRPRLHHHLRRARHRRRAAGLGERGLSRRSKSSARSSTSSTPACSILAEPTVALVDKNVDRHGTRARPTSYLRFLYSPRAQDLIGKHHFRPRECEGLGEIRREVQKAPLVTIDGQFGGWKKAQATHFADGGVFDRIYKS